MSSSSSSSSTKKALTSIEVFKKFISESDAEDSQTLDASKVFSSSCFDKWLSTRASAPKKPEESFRRALTAHVRGNDGRQPFTPSEEAAVLRHLRQNDPFGGMFQRGIRIGRKKFKGQGYHEQKRSKKVKAVKEDLKKKRKTQGKRARPKSNQTDTSTKELSLSQAIRLENDAHIAKVSQNNIGIGTHISEVSIPGVELELFKEDLKKKRKAQGKRARPKSNQTDTSTKELSLSQAIRLENDAHIAKLSQNNIGIGTHISEVSIPGVELELFKGTENSKSGIRHHANSNTMYTGVNESSFFENQTLQSTKYDSGVLGLSNTEPFIEQPLSNEVIMHPEPADPKITSIGYSEASELINLQPYDQQLEQNANSREKRIKKYEIKKDIMAVLDAIVSRSNNHREVEAFKKGVMTFWKGLSEPELEHMCLTYVMHGFTFFGARVTSNIGILLNSKDQKDSLEFLYPGNTVSFDKYRPVGKAVFSQKQFKWLESDSETIKLLKGDICQYETGKAKLQFNWQHACLHSIHGLAFIATAKVGSEIWLRQNIINFEGEPIWFLNLLRCEEPGFVSSYAQLIPGLEPSRNKFTFWT